MLKGNKTETEKLDLLHCQFMAFAKELLGSSLVEKPSFVSASGFSFNHHQFKRRQLSRIGTLRPMPTARLGLEMLPCSHWSYSSNQKHYLQPCRPQGQQKGLSALADDDQQNVEKLHIEDGNTYQNGLSKLLDTFIQFSRPYASIGSLVGTITASLFPVEAIADLSPKFFMGIFQAVVAGLLMKTYVSGINHLYDVEIDKINKKHFPLASGAYSIETGWVVTITSALLSFCIGSLAHSPPLLYGLLITFVFGTVNSVNLPFLRWKKHPLLSAVSLMFLSMPTIYIPIFIHSQRYLLGRPVVITTPVLLATVIACIHSIAFFIFKDIPDTEGDKVNGIRTFSTEYGREKAFSVGINVLLVEYAIGIIVGAFSASNLFSKFVMVAGHCFLALALWFHSRSVDITNNSAAFSLYIFVWQLFYLENVVLLLYR